MCKELVPLTIRSRHFRPFPTVSSRWFYRLGYSDTSKCEQLQAKKFKPIIAGICFNLCVKFQLRYRILKNLYSNVCRKYWARKLRIPAIYAGTKHDSIMTSYINNLYLNIAAVTKRPPSGISCSCWICAKIENEAMLVGCFFSN